MLAAALDLRLSEVRDTNVKLSTVHKGLYSSDETTPEGNKLKSKLIALIE